MDISTVKRIALVGAIIGGLWALNATDNFLKNRQQIKLAKHHLSLAAPSVLTWQEQSIDTFFFSGMSGNELKKFISSMQNDYGSCFMLENPDCHMRTNHVSCPYAQHLKQTIECEVPISCKKARYGLLTVQLLKDSLKCVSFGINAR